MIDRLLRRASPADFLRRYYHFLPYAEPEGCRDLLDLGDAARFDRIRAAAGRDVVVAHGGGRATRDFDGTAEGAAALLGEGHTLVVRHAERFDEGLATLARAFRAALGGTVDVHAIETPEGSPGFGWHCDHEEVFALQLAGAKTYRLRKQTVHPWPVPETIRQQTSIDLEGSPLRLDCALEAGDWLYVPCGWWHAAEGRARSRSFAVGVSAPSGLDVLDAVRRTAVDSLLWRRRIPVSALDGRTDEERVERTRAVLAELLGDLRETVTADAWIREFLATTTAVEERAS
jgi:ribosomal protein L16 Arg81 hydroxylase